MLGGIPLSAASKEEDAKKFAGDLKSKDAKVRLMAVTGLGDIGAASLKYVTPYIDQITEAVADKDAKVRGEASRTLGRVDPPEKKPAVEAIAKALKNEKDATGPGRHVHGPGRPRRDDERGRPEKAVPGGPDRSPGKVTEKREQKMIQAALQTINGTAKK